MTTQYIQQRVRDIISKHSLKVNEVEFAYLCLVYVEARNDEIASQLEEFTK